MSFQFKYSQVIPLDSKFFFELKWIRCCFHVNFEEILLKMLQSLQPSKAKATLPGPRLALFTLYCELVKIKNKKLVEF